MTLSSELPDVYFVTRNYLDTAKHEMLHLLLMRLTELGQYRFLQRRELEEAEHEVVMQLLKIIR